MMERNGTKHLGDAGEHFALSQFSFAGKYAAKMPDNWEAYDLVVESGKGLARVSVKTRRETERWSSGSWFVFDDRKKCDWYVFIFKSSKGAIRAWVIPSDVCLANANEFTEKRKEPWVRDVTYAKLNRAPLARYESNWRMEHEPAEKS